MFYLCAVIMMFWGGCQPSEEQVPYQAIALPISSGRPDDDEPDSDLLPAPTAAEICDGDECTIEWPLPTPAEVEELSAQWMGVFEVQADLAVAVLDDGTPAFAGVTWPLGGLHCEGLRCPSVQNPARNPVLGHLTGGAPPGAIELAVLTSEVNQSEYIAGLASAMMNGEQPSPLMHTLEVWWVWPDQPPQLRMSAHVTTECLVMGMELVDADLNGVADVVLRELGMSGGCASHVLQLDAPYPQFRTDVLPPGPSQYGRIPYGQTLVTLTGRQDDMGGEAGERAVRNDVVRCDQWNGDQWASDLRCPHNMAGSPMGGAMVNFGAAPELIVSDIGAPGRCGPGVVDCFEVGMQNPDLMHHPDSEAAHISWSVIPVPWGECQGALLSGAFHDTSPDGDMGLPSEGGGRDAQNLALLTESSCSGGRSLDQVRSPALDAPGHWRGLLSWPTSGGPTIIATPVNDGGSVRAFRLPHATATPVRLLSRTGTDACGAIAFPGDPRREQVAICSGGYSGHFPPTAWILAGESEVTIAWTDGSMSTHSTIQNVIQQP